MTLIALCKIPQKAGLLTNQIFRVLKITVFIIFAACLQVSAKGFGQGNITLSLKNVSLQQAIKEIEKASSYGFIYSYKEFPVTKKIDLNVTNATINEVLDTILKGLPLTYSIVDKTVVLKPKNTITDNEVSIQFQNSSPPVDIKGKIVNEKNEPVIGASVRIKGTKTGTSTNERGEFTLRGVSEDAILLVTAVNIETIEFRLNGSTEVNLVAKTRVRENEAITVIGNTGYQVVKPNEVTGSVQVIDNKALNQRVSTDILSRLEGVASSVFFDKRNQSANSSTVIPSNIIIRGLSTITNTPVSIRTPLIILNNFPYDGDINNINPNDVESITILKDAAAASIWGARAGNGVIVISTKQGKYNQQTHLSITANVNFIEKPDLFSYPKMSTSDFIDVESFLFSKGFYNGSLNNTVARPALSPVVEILAKRRAGTISASDSARQIDALRNLDVRNDFEKYIYRLGVNQQYFLNLNGGSQKIKYSLSGGFDNNLSNLVGNKTQRATLRFDNSLALVKNLDVDLGFGYTNSESTNNSLGDYGSANYNYRSGQNLFPYAQFADAEGNSIIQPHDYRIGYVDTAGAGKLLDWHYSPLDELKNADNTSKLQDVLFNIRGNYKFSACLSASVNYQYERSNGYTKNYYSPQTYYTRNLINLFTQLSGNAIFYAVPPGGILTELYSNLTSQSERAQINWDKNWNDKHQIIAVGGEEIRGINSNSTGRRVYGYDPDRLTTTNVDYVNTYPQYGGRGNALIPNFDGYTKTLNRFVSFFGNAAYTYDKRYTLSASARKDASNLFGVDINNKWKPFWSLGSAWTISNEKFYSLKAIQYLRLRATYGYQGNVNNTISPLTIIQISSANNSLINQPLASISNPADPSLSWETIAQFNIGLDFATLKNRLSGTLEVYNKKSNNLIFGAQIDPTSGLGSVSKNSASLVGNGVDITINSVNINAAFKWQTSLLYSHVTDKVTNYFIDDSKRIIGGLAGTGLSILPVKGRSPYGMYSYPFAGLDPTTGDPLGFMNGKTSKDYAAFLNQTLDTAHLIYNGSALPTTFGFLNNTFSYKSISLIVSLSYRFGYYFRKSTINYASLYASGASNADFAKRWIKPGDEVFTTVPSMIYPGNPQRDGFYANSTATVFKGDNVRLDFVRLSYIFDKAVLKKTPIQSIQVFGYASNLGILWRANKERLDPDYDVLSSVFPPPKTVAVGLKIDF